MSVSVTPKAPLGQLERLNRLLRYLWDRNPFYARKWRSAGLSARELCSLEALADFPFTTRAELMKDQSSQPPLGSNLTCSLIEIKHIHRSSGTTRAPLFWGDTPQSWDWVTLGSQLLFELSGVTATDSVLFILPFGCSSGPWIIHEGARRLGCCCFSVDPNDIEGQLLSLRHAPSVLVGKPATLDALKQVAGNWPTIEKLILTGERSDSWFGHESFARYGLTEAGSVAAECTAHVGMHLIATHFIAEVIDTDSEEPVGDGDPGELVLTTLGRLSQPIVRYRTGDLVRLLRDHNCPCGRRDALLVGGVQRNHNAAAAGDCIHKSAAQRNPRL